VHSKFVALSITTRYQRSRFGSALIRLVTSAHAGRCTIHALVKQIDGAEDAKHLFTDSPKFPSLRSSAIICVHISRPTHFLTKYYANILQIPLSIESGQKIRFSCECPFKYVTTSISHHGAKAPPRYLRQVQPAGNMPATRFLDLALNTPKAKRFKSFNRNGGVCWNASMYESGLRLGGGLSNVSAKRRLCSCQCRF
jgi:hypothetical protein